MYYCYHPTPIGDLLLAGDESALAIIGFPEGSMRRDPDADWIYNEKPFAKAARQLDEYFAGFNCRCSKSCRRSRTARPPRIGMSRNGLVDRRRCVL